MDVILCLKVDFGVAGGGERLEVFQPVHRLLLLR
jgi:hypothetical protein